jgi:hypothetical protein
LAKVLKRIPQDCTDDQNKFKDILSNGKTFYSVDLSNATDRFPIDLIYQVLLGRLPEHYVKA